MKGVMIPEVSAGSNQVGASETCAAQVSWPEGPAACEMLGIPAVRPSVASASASRRVKPRPACHFDRDESTMLLLIASLRSRSPLDRDVLVGRGVRKQRDLAEPGLADPRAGAVDKGELPDRRVDDPLGHDLLDLVQDRFALRAIELDRLLLVQFVDIGIAAV